MSLCNCRLGKHQANCGLFHSGDLVLTEQDVEQAWRTSPCTCPFDYYKFAQDIHSRECPLWLKKRMRRGEEMLDGISGRDPARPLNIYTPTSVDIPSAMLHNFDRLRHQLYLVGVLRACKAITGDDDEVKAHSNSSR